MKFGEGVIMGNPGAKTNIRGVILRLKISDLKEFLNLPEQESEVTALFINNKPSHADSIGIKIYTMDPNDDRLPEVREMLGYTDVDLEFWREIAEGYNHEKT